jgi:catechol 2,3-dioxygenase-like lactoylglutathione lyase family enzyme
MAIRLGSVVINCADIELMTQFWTAALDLQAGPLSPEGDFRVLGGSVTAISLQVAKTPVSGRDQMHLDLFTHEQDAEVHRLLGLGAEFVRHNEDPDDDFVVLQDPEGNFFCVCALPDDQTSEEREEQQERASGQ